MSGDETMVMLASFVLTGFLWFRWFAEHLNVNDLSSGSRHRALLFVTPLACTAILFAILRSYASGDVRDDGTYLAMYQVMGGAWVGLAALGFPYLGLNARDDVTERRNMAAAWAVSGALLGVTLCFAGANIGDGPGWWVVVFSGGLATGALGVVAFLVAQTGGADEHISVDRDTSSGLRLGALLAACGLILGRAAAGNWVSAQATVTDFVRMGWPAIVLAIVASMLERALAPSSAAPTRQAFFFGIVPGTAYLILAATWVRILGAWS